MTSPKVPRKISDYIKPPEPFYPDAPQYDVAALATNGTPITLIETQALKYQSSKFDKPGETLLFAFTWVGEREIMTSITSHLVLVRKLKELTQKKAYPVTGKIVHVQPEGGNNPYFDLVDA